MNAEEPGEEEPAARATQPLERGEATGINDLRAVAGLATPHPGGCTATYIGHRVVLTAAHCVSPFGSVCVGSTQLPEDIEATFADQFGDPTNADAQRIRVLPVDSVLAKATDGRLGLVDEKGRIIVVDGLLSPTLKDRLSDSGLLVVGAVEPYLGAGRGYRGVQGVFVTTDATATVGSIVGSEDGFRMQREELIDRDPILKSATVPAGAAALDGIPPRAGFAAVLSRTLGALVIVGGNDATSGRPSRDIWMVPEQGLPSQLMVPGYAPERVLAATVAPSDGSLWILDELRLSSWFRIARLVRIDPASGEHELVWRGPRLGLFDRQWLGADRDGQVLLSSSSNSLRKHVIVRFEAEPYGLGTAQAVLARFGQGALLGAPLVDHAGYQIVTAKGANRIRSDRIGSLGQRPGLVVDLTKCL